MPYHGAESKRATALLPTQASQHPRVTAALQVMHQLAKTVDKNARMHTTHSPQHSSMSDILKAKYRKQNAMNV